MSRRLIFSNSPEPTLGVEIELGLVNAETLALCSANEAILEQVPDPYKDAVKPELMQCYVEVNSKVGLTLPEVEADIWEKLRWLEATADKLGVRLLWSSTHPFSSWREQEITRNARYQSLVNLLQDTARQLVTFGLHVHVGVDSGDKAIMICERIQRHLPTLLALSSNSPFWEGRETGLQSWRSRVMDGLPTAGLPPLMRNWSEYVWLVNHLVDTGYIETIREIWWDVRPHHNFGTVEVRICDMPGSLEDTMAIVALIHSLVKRLSDEIDHGTYQHDSHPMLIRQNKWHAARYGLEAHLVDSDTFELYPVRQILHQMADQLKEVGATLDCNQYLERIHQMADAPSWADYQLQLSNKVTDPKELVRRLIESARLQSVPVGERK